MRPTIRFRPGRMVIPQPPPASPQYFGLGDLVALAAEPIKGQLQKVPWLREHFKGCGCAERRKRWNARWPLWKKGPGVGVNGDP